MFAIAIIASFACSSCNALKLAAVVKANPDIQNRSGAGILLNASGGAHQEDVARRLTTGLRLAENTTSFSFGDGISINAEGHSVVKVSELVEEMKQEPAGSEYWGIPTVTHGNLWEPGTSGETSPFGWVCVCFLFVVWMMWGFELLWAVCVQRRTSSLNLIAYASGGAMMVKASGIIFGAYAQLTAMCLFSFLLVIDILFFILWEVTRKLTIGGRMDRPSAAWTRSMGQHGQAWTSSLELLQADLDVKRMGHF